MSFRSSGVLILVFFCAASAVIGYAPAATRASDPAVNPVGPPEIHEIAATVPQIPSPQAWTEPAASASNDEIVPATASSIQVATNVTIMPLLPPALTTTPPPAPAVRHATRADVAALVAEMHGQLGGTLLPDAPALTRAALDAAHVFLRQAHVAPETFQVVLVVDRSPKVQRLWVTVATPGSSVLEALGSVHVSTGKPGRKEHFRTPVGVFIDDASILGYRALGTYNENHIRGIGLHGMRVWDFGWQTTDDWRTPHALMAVRMEMHATDPSVLEPRLGRWDSEGCIRIPTRFNSFLDQTGLIDAKEREAAQDDRRFAALLPKHTVPNPLAGQTLVVVDTSDPDAALSDPVRAHLIAHPAITGPEHDDAS